MPRCSATALGGRAIRDTEKEAHRGLLHLLLQVCHAKASQSFGGSHAVGSSQRGRLIVFRVPRQGYLSPVTLVVYHRFLSWQGYLASRRGENMCAK